MRWPKAAAKILLALVLAALTLELSFRLAGALTRIDRGTSALSGAHDVILCVGDSHTWGRGKGYPARLGERLGERAPRYRVINMGVPGSNTAQARKRLPGYLERFQPRLLVVWAGVNNKYNRADSEVWQDAGVGQASWLRSLLDSSRVLRFIRLWQNERELGRFLDGEGAYVKPDDGGGPEQLPGKDGGASLRFRRGLMGETDVFEHLRGDKLPGAEMSRVTELDVRSIIEQARADQVPIVLVTYPLEGSWFREANAGIRAAAAAAGVPVVDSAKVLQHLKEDFRRRGEKTNKQTFFDPSVHPQQVLYDAIGDAILELADARGLLGAGDGAPVGGAGLEVRVEQPISAAVTGRDGHAP